MAADGTISTGKDGVIEIAGIAEIPCLTEWTLSGTPQLQENVVECMKSNGDNVDGGWNEPEVVGKGWTVEAQFYFQKATAGASAQLDATNVGTKVAVRLEPVAVSDDYGGDAYLTEIENLGTVDGKILHRATLVGNGLLHMGAEPAVSGSAPAEELLSLKGEAESVDTSTWFTGGGMTYTVDVLPDGFSLDPDTGIISGTLTGTDEPLDVTVRATNAMGYAEHTFIWLTWDARADAKGWYDNRDTSTLKTDLVASFDRANSEYLSITDANQSGLNFAGEFTVAGWINTTGLTNNNCIVSKYGPGGYRLLQIWTGQFRLYARDNVGTQRLVASSVNYTPSSGWLFVVAGYDGTNIFLTVNDQATPNTSTFTGPMTTSALAFNVGKDAATHNDGQLADVACWSRTLSASEITALYNSGTPRHYADLSTSEKVDLVSFWNLNEPRGVRYDSHGSNHLTDNNTVGAEHGPVEYEATQYAGITKWENQGADASPFADVVTPTALKSAQLINGLPTWDGVNSASLHSTTGTVTPDSAIYVVAKAASDGPATAGLVDSDDAILRNLIYLVSDKLNLFARPNGALSGGDSVVTTNDGHARFGIYAELQPTSMTVKVGGETFQNTSATPGEMIGLSIGGYYNQSVSGSWDGTIEAVLVFDRVLTSAELAELEALYV
jgi:hypothetical protein